jgi:hydrogenase maturation protease
MRTIIIGIGNPIRSDDAVGLVVARILRRRLREVSNVDVEELHAGGLRLVEAMVGYDRAVVIDAMVTGTQPPGSVRRLAFEELARAHNITCVHDTSLPAALEIWRRTNIPVPNEITVWGIEGEDLMTVSEELSPTVSEGAKTAVQAILDELRPTTRCLS